MGYISFEALHEVFDGVSHGFGPHIPMLTLCDFYLWRSLNGKVYKMNLHILEEITSPGRFQQFLRNCCSGKKWYTLYLVLLNPLTLWTSPPPNVLKVIKLMDYYALGTGSAPVFWLVSKT
jgi:hypothetical protein